MSLRLLFGYAALTLVAIILAGLFGIALRVITQETPSPSRAKTHAPHYVVRPGDALMTISQKTGIPVDRLKELNPSLDPLSLVPGERVKLRQPTLAERTRARRRWKARPTHYVIKRGDTPSSIAEKTGVPLDTLFELNRGLRGKTLYPGQRLRLRR